MTMIELLAVMTIVAMMLAMSAAVYWQMSQNMKQQGAAGDLDVALRQARNNAISSNAPAFVEIDSAGHTVTPWVYKTVGQWHFESKDGFGRTPGPHNTAAVRGAAEIKDNGKIGKCILLKPGGCIDAGTNPDFDLDDGGCLEAYIRPRSLTEGGTGYVFFKEHCYFLMITTKGSLEASAGGRSLKAPDYHLAPGRWTKVAFAWDPHSQRILVDDAIVAIGKGCVPEISDHPLIIGHDQGGFEGSID
jgi:type II secretory pathway pseudopilin PulG